MEDGGRHLELSACSARVRASFGATVRGFAQVLFWHECCNGWQPRVSARKSSSVTLERESQPNVGTNIHSSSLLLFFFRFFCVFALSPSAISNGSENPARSDGPVRHAEHGCLDQSRTSSTPVAPTRRFLDMYFSIASQKSARSTRSKANARSFYRALRREGELTLECRRKVAELGAHVREAYELVRSHARQVPKAQS